MSEGPFNEQTDVRQSFNTGYNVGEQITTVGGALFFLSEEDPRPPSAIKRCY